MMPYLRVERIVTSRTDACRDAPFEGVGNLSKGPFAGAREGPLERAARKVADRRRAKRGAGLGLMDSRSLLAAGATAGERLPSPSGTRRHDEYQT